MPSTTPSSAGILVLDDDGPFATPFNPVTNLDEGLGNRQLVIAAVPELIGNGWSRRRLLLEMPNIDEEARDRFSRLLQ